MKEQKLKYYLAASISVITFTVYLFSLGNGFIEWDDNEYIFENSYIRAFNLSFFRWAFLDFHAANWHPLTWISHALDYAIWGLNPQGHHLTNVVLHSLNTLLAVFLAIRLIEAYKQRTTELVPKFLNEKTILIIGGVTGVLFGLHPLHVESVAWVAERKDLLCALFFLLSLITYTHSAQRVAHSSYKRFFNRGYLLTLGFFILALLSKPMAVSLPVVLLILDWHPLNRVSTFRTLRAALVEKIPFAALSLCSSLITILAQKSGGAMERSEIFSLWSRLLVAVHSLIAYLGKMLLPLDLIPYYPYPKNVSLFSFRYLSAVVLMIGITMFCLSLAKRRKVWLAAWGYYMATLVPVLGIIKVGGQAMADRYTYLPSLGPFLLAGLMTAWGWEKTNASKSHGSIIHRISMVAAVIVFVSMIFFTVRQISIWIDSIVFWNYVIEKAPESDALPYFCRGNAFRRLDRFEEAIQDFDKAIALNPTYYESYYNRGNAFYRMDLPDNAIHDFDKAIALKPSDPKAYINRGLAYQRVELFDKTIEDLNRAITLDPDDYETYNNRGAAYVKMGLRDSAIEDFKKAIALKPSDCSAYNGLGILYGGAGSFGEAIELFTKSLAVDPDYIDAYYNRGHTYFLIGQYGAALEDFNKAIRLNQNYTRAYLKRGDVYLRTGDKGRAAADYRKACDFGNQNGCNAWQKLESL